jgi:succinoglycan biosynthesis transport protein ExoP
METGLPEERRERVRSLGDYAALLRRRWIYPAFAIPLILLGSIFIAFTTTPVYRAAATIMLSPSSIPEDIVRSTVPSAIPGMRNAVVNYADQQFDLVRRRVLSVSRLTEVVETIDPYPDLKGLSPRDKAELLLANVYVEPVDPITFEPLEESTAFTVYYSNEHPERAAAVARELARLFLEYKRESRVEQAIETYQFLRIRAEELRLSVAQTEAKLAAFKRRFPTSLPEDRARNQLELDSSERELISAQAQLRLAEQRQAAFETQLSQVNPTLVGAVTDPRTELATLKSQLAEAERKYTPDHPVVKRLRRSIETLAATDPSMAGRPGQQADNPEYLRIATELESSKRETAALRSQVGRMQGQIATLRGQLVNAPGVEMEYAALTREVGAARQQLLETEEKLRDAELASQLETEQKGEQYTLIKSPGIPDSPYRPNRLSMILLGAALAFALGIGSAVLVDIFDPTVRNTDDVREVSSYPVLANIGVLMNAESRAKQRRLRLVFAGSLATALLLVGVSVTRTLLRPDPEPLEIGPATESAPSASTAGPVAGN